ncbi:hypothetical protein E2C01_036729 [Portunus trituberculatus]|uniref:Uncharacterized protein n=1 Tax=Portunus trituberculatus TaxID=210409 RepID=A0A5B7F7G7_PORTR|nr:hypothetical protein [Portunus trituberculatus]
MDPAGESQIMPFPPPVSPTRPQCRRASEAGRGEPGRLSHAATRVTSECPKSRALFRPRPGRGTAPVIYVSQDDVQKAKEEAARQQQREDCRGESGRGCLEAPLYPVQHSVDSLTCRALVWPRVEESEGDVTPREVIVMFNDSHANFA